MMIRIFATTAARHPFAALSAAMRSLCVYGVGLTLILTNGVPAAARDESLPVVVELATDGGTSNLIPDWLAEHSVLFDDAGRIQTVYLGDKATDEVMRRLTSLPKLLVLHIGGGGELTKTGLRMLGQMPALQRLELHRFGRPADATAAWTSDEAMRSVGQLTSLRELVAANCGITDQGVTQLKNLTGLTLLSLRQNQITDESLQTLRDLKSLKSLDLGCHVRDAAYGKNNLTDESMYALQPLTQLEYINVEGTGASPLKLDLPQLRSLSISQTFREQGVRDRDIIRLQKYPELRHLSIRSDLVTDYGLSALGRLEHLSSLELNCAGLTDSGIRHLVGLPLTRLSLSTGQLTDEGLSQVALIETLESLEISNAAATTIKGFQQLASLSQLRSLRLTNLRAPGSRVGFGVLTQLRELQFTGSIEHWTQEDLDQLGKSLPEASIHVMTGGGFYAPQGDNRPGGMKIPPRRRP